MQSFPKPVHNLKYFKFNDANELHKKNLFETIPFHSVHLLLPSSADFQEDCLEISNNHENIYFILKNVSVSALVHDDFLQNFLRNGSLYALSQLSHRNIVNFISITESGKLILQLDNNIAGYLSLPKEKLSHKSSKDHNVPKISTINIASKDFIPGKKYYEAVVSELKKIDHTKFDLILKWKPNGDICCESIREYFESKGLECLPCEQLQKQEIVCGISVPNVNFNDMNPDLLESYMEWIGTQICGIDCASETDKYVSNFCEPQHSESRNLFISTYQGFYTSHELYEILEKVRNLFSKDKNLPFIALAINGYQCCYIDSKNFEKVSSDDKLICIFITPDFSCLAMTLNV